MALIFKEPSSNQALKHTNLQRNLVASVKIPPQALWSLGLYFNPSSSI